MPKTLKNFYVTFGSDILFPFPNQFIIVRTTGYQNVYTAFDKIYPPRPGSNVSNFAFAYTEKEWLQGNNNIPVKHYYKNMDPVVIITDEGDHPIVETFKEYLQNHNEKPFY